METKLILCPGYVSATFSQEPHKAPVAAFYANSRRGAKGLSYRCRECHKARQRDYREDAEAIKAKAMSNADRLLRAAEALDEVVREVALSAVIARHIRRTAVHLRREADTADIAA